jgi:hypothetical protein
LYEAHVRPTLVALTFVLSPREMACETSCPVADGPVPEGLENSHVAATRSSFVFYEDRIRPKVGSRPAWQDSSVNLLSVLGTVGKCQEVQVLSSGQSGEMLFAGILSDSFALARSLKNIRGTADHCL